MLYRIYLPLAIPHPVREWVKGGFLTTFGGYTRWDARGTWNDKDGETISEDVEIVEAFGPCKESAASMLADACDFILSHSDEQSVAYVVGWDIRLAERRAEHAS